MEEFLGICAGLKTPNGRIKLLQNLTVHELPLIFFTQVIKDGKMVYLMPENLIFALHASLDFTFSFEP